MIVFSEIYNLAKCYEYSISIKVYLLSSQILKVILYYLKSSY